MQEFLPVVCIIGVVVLVGGCYWWWFRSSYTLLDNWAAQNGHTILAKELRMIRRGPFFWTSSNGQRVFYVTVRTSGGDTRRGWVRLGGFFFGLLSEHVDVRWED